MKKSLWIGGSLIGLIAVLLFVDTAFGQNAVVRRLQDLFDVERGVTPSEGEAPVWSSAQQQFVWGAPSAADTNAIANADGFGTNTTLRGTATIDGLLQILNNNAGIGRVWTDTNGSGIGHWADAAGGSGDLLAANNLSDVDDAGASRTNLVAHDASNLTIGTIDNDLLSDIPASAMASGSLSGDGTVLGTVAGTLTQDKQLAFDANGNIVASASDIGGVGSGSPGGADTMLQFNESGDFAGTTNFVYDQAAGRIVVGSGHIDFIGNTAGIKFNTGADVRRYEIVPHVSDGSISFNALDATETFAFETLKLDASGNAIFQSTSSTAYEIGSSSASVSTNATGELEFTDPVAGALTLAQFALTEDFDEQTEQDALGMMTKTGTQNDITGTKGFLRTGSIFHDLGNVGTDTTIPWSTNAWQLVMTDSFALDVSGDPPEAGILQWMVVRVQQDAGGENFLTNSGVRLNIDTNANAVTFISFVTNDEGVSMDVLDLDDSEGSGGSGITGITADSGGTTTGDPVTFSGGTGISTVRSTDTITANLDNTVVTPGSYVAANVTVDQQGRLTAAASAPRSSINTVGVVGTATTPITANPYTLSAADSYGAVIRYNAAGEIDLPALAAGMNVIIYNHGANTITIDPNGSEVIEREGTAQTGGVSMTLSAGAGNFVALYSDGVRWVTLGFKGTLAEGT